MWEIYDGKDRRPYYKYNNDKVREIILEGVTLETPEEKFPPRIKQIMEQCWKTKSERPFFKGQLIFRGPFGVFKSTKKSNKIFVRISTLASKKRSNQKSSVRESK